MIICRFGNLKANINGGDHICYVADQMSCKTPPCNDKLLCQKKKQTAEAYDAHHLLRGVQSSPRLCVSSIPLTTVNSRCISNDSSLHFIIILSQAIHN